MKILNRAKALNSMENYVISQSIKFEKGKMYLYSIPFKQWVECDESTRSLQIEGMTDSEENPIFTSLSKDGKGGDIIQENNSIGLCIIERGRCMIDWIEDKDFFSRDLCNHHKNSKVIEIQK